ncbi:MAG: SpoIID/LytB domain-containing protein [Phycisphaerae bacterium]
MMKSNRILLLSCLLAAVIAGCQEPPAVTTVPAPNPVPPVAATGPSQARIPAPVVPAIPSPLPKPKVLGPSMPSIVVVPPGMREPMIRVRLTDELSYRPVIKKAYRGRLEVITLPNGKFVAVNVVPVDDYLAGVLPKEILNSWSPEVFRAQAIAARTFALFQMFTDGKDKPWDVSNDTASQMYGGVSGETARSRAAVAATAGQVLMASLNGHEGIFCARYSACTGGATQDPFDAWGDPSLPVLAARKLGNIENISPSAHLTWAPMVVRKSDISRCIHAWAQRNALPYLAPLGEIRSVVISGRNAVTGRPSEIKLTDTAGHWAPVRAEEFRLALLHDPAGSAPKPPSSWFEIRDLGNAIELYNGRGHGHGIGMSQWGAQALALRGESYRQILEFFYPGAAIKQVW